MISDTFFRAVGAALYWRSKAAIALGEHEPRIETLLEDVCAKANIYLTTDEKGAVVGHYQTMVRQHG